MVPLIFPVVVVTIPPRTERNPDGFIPGSGGATLSWLGSSVQSNSQHRDSREPHPINFSLGRPTTVVLGPPGPKSDGFGLVSIGPWDVSIAVGSSGPNRPTPRPFRHSRFKRGITISSPEPLCFRLNVPGTPFRGRYSTRGTASHYNLFLLPAKKIKTCVSTTFLRKGGCFNCGGTDTTAHST